MANLDANLVEGAYAEITRIIEDAVDAMKTSAGDVKVILVGGGSILSPEELEGASEVIRPGTSAWPTPWDPRYPRCRARFRRCSR